jgi:hypothetical protein
MPLSDIEIATDYSTLINLFVQLVESQNGKKVEPGEEWLHNGQTLSVKLLRHLVSMQVLAAGTVIEQDPSQTLFFIDHASVKVIARAALETYLVFFYLYGGGDNATSRFRHMTWKLGGLTDRQKYVLSKAEHLEVLRDERERMNELLSEIKAEPQLQAYTPRQQTKLLNGEWRVGRSWFDLGKNAGFPESYFRNIYNYLCGYSHSSFAGVLQANQATSNKDQKMLSNGILIIGTQIMAHFIFTYPSLFRHAVPALAANVEGKRIAEKCRFQEESLQLPA